MERGQEVAAYLLRTTVAEKKAWEEAAAAAGVPLARWLVTLANRAARRAQGRPPADKVRGRGARSDLREARP